MTKWYRPWSTWGKSSRHLASMASMSLVHERGCVFFVLSCLVLKQVWKLREPPGGIFLHLWEPQSKQKARPCLLGDVLKMTSSRCCMRSCPAFQVYPEPNKTVHCKTQVEHVSKGNLICTWEFTFFMKLSDLHMLMHILMLNLSFF